MNELSIFSFLTTLFLVVCTQGQEIVKDSAGNPVKVGQRYVIQPVKTPSNNGGGLAPAPISIPFCPLGISQISVPDQPGLPVSFITLNGLSPSQDMRTNTDYMIVFDSEIGLVCNDFSKLWAVEMSDVKEPPIIVGGKYRAITASFFVEKAEGANTYKLSSTVFGNIGTKPGGLFDAPQLVVTNDNAKRLLFKLSATTSTTTSTSLEKPGLRMFPF